MTLRTRLFSIAAIIIVLGGGTGGFLYWKQISEYVSTDDAFINGRQIVISAPASGKITDWTGIGGTTYPSGATIGDIEVTSGDASSSVPIPIPANSTIIQRTAVNGEYVAMGTPLAYAYNLNNLWVTANVKETEIRYVNLGAPVDITVDAYPGLLLHGKVEQIEAATASTFSLIPSESTNANFTKVTQVIPVKISIENSPIASLAPGMSVEVKIHKQS
ncbi:HlyD family secretion protein [Alicyclobacillus tolerans]|uniref:Barrel-sandwich domain of CusB or HlyD membrane-fusion n=1 Tax=Alicyclobacillus tolerans TaxID=90970 RepID=A0A1M6TFY6_9BACL|nr:efflux RND transporter periplasmic adaptor subunit [Alicyclobacillus montanus]SHK55880.1 Barrel-sandwich domain of CusB or HlyD membrane-fusion [Alicyclobacillus montanus]